MLRGSKRSKGVLGAEQIGSPLSGAGRIVSSLWFPFHVLIVKGDDGGFFCREKDIYLVSDGGRYWISAIPCARYDRMDGQTSTVDLVGNVTTLENRNLDLATKYCALGIPHFARRGEPNLLWTYAQGMPWFPIHRGDSCANLYAFQEYSFVGASGDFQDIAHAEKASDIRSGRIIVDFHGCDQLNNRALLRDVH